MNNRSDSKSFKGPLLVLLSSVSFSTSGLLMKYIPWFGLTINGARNTIAFLTLLPFFVLSGHKIVRSRSVFQGAFALAVTSSLFAAANKMTTAGNVIILQFTAPVFVMLFMLLLYHKKPVRRDIVTAVFVFGGVICFFVDGLSAGHLAGDLLALLSGVTYAFVFMMNASRDGDPLSSVFFGTILSAVIGMPFFFRENLTAATPRVWICLLLIGVVQQGLSYMLLAKGLETTPAVPASLISSLEPILNPILVAVFYGELLSPLALAGAAVVFAAILIYNVLNLRHEAGDSV